MSADIWSVLKSGLTHGQLNQNQWQILTDWELEHWRQAQAWNITPNTVQSAMEQRFYWLQQVVPNVAQLPLPPAPIDNYLPLLWQLWIPLALHIKQLHQDLKRPLIYGVLGGQGTGKTTLSQILQFVLRLMDRTMVGFSIDDIYKTYQERQQLRQVDPRLIWRGPPGTHDIDLGIETLEKVRQQQGPVSFPRFDKALHGGEGDQSDPEVIDNVDVVLFEGWFLGVQPLERMDWRQAPSPIDTEADRQFAQDMNRQLQAYLPLWKQLDRLMVLIPEDYRLSQEWRLQAEQQMKARGKTGMEDEAVRDFVQYFWKALHPELFILPLRQAEWIDLVVEVGANRCPKAIYSPRR